MTKEQLAAKLNGREYGREITHEEADEARQSGLLVLFGASDDLVELRGKIDAEGELLHIDACWCKEKGGPSWTFETEAPHATFEIPEDGEVFCRGIVIDVKELA